MVRFGGRQSAAGENPSEGDCIRSLMGERGVSATHLASVRGEGQLWAFEMVFVERS